MEQLFLELLRVSIEKMDCVERGPSAEEWLQLYRMSQHHQMVSICYHGVERLFDYGLRGPQDMVLDWMSDAENNSVNKSVVYSLMPIVARYDYQKKVIYQPETECSPFKNWRLRQWFQKNHSMIPSPDDRLRPSTLPMSLFCLLLHAQQALLRGRLTLRPILDCYYLLHLAEGHFGAFLDGRSFKRQLSAWKLLDFAQGVMWIIQEVFELSQASMPCEPSEQEGRFILQEVMSERCRLWRLMKHYPIKIIWTLI